MVYRTSTLCAALLWAWLLGCWCCPATAAEEDAANNLLVWQNYSSGDVVWWKVDDQGEILSEEENTGWGLVSETHKVPEGWELVGSYPADDLHVLIWHNRSKGLVAYWRISSDGSLVGVEDSGWGLVSSEMRVGSNWELTSISKVGEHEVLFWRNLVNGMVAFWRLNTDSTLLDSTQGSGWGYVAEGVDLSKGWVLGGVVDIGSATTMIWRNEAAGKVAFWRINTQGCTMQDIQEGSGWGMVSGNLKVGAKWKLRAVVVVNSQPMLLWQNSNTGVIVYWKLNSEGELADDKQGSGWGLVHMDPALEDGFIFAGATVVENKVVFFLRQLTTGAVYHVALDPANPSAFQSSENPEDFSDPQQTPDAYGLVAPNLRMDASWTLRAILDTME